MTRAPIAMARSASSRSSPKPWLLAGYPSWATLIDALPYQPLRGRDARLDLVERARRGRPRRLLRADARGMLLAIDYALATGLFTGPLASEAMRLRWLARGGHAA